eukprot:m51a1_g4748 hypothetical protein (903) ;mRNA; r:395640-399443
MSAKAFEELDAVLSNLSQFGAAADDPNAGQFAVANVGTPPPARPRPVAQPLYNERGVRQPTPGGTWLTGGVGCDRVWLVDGTSHEVSASDDWAVRDIVRAACDAEGMGPGDHVLMQLSERGAQQQQQQQGERFLRGDRTLLEQCVRGSATLGLRMRWVKAPRDPSNPRTLRQYYLAVRHSLLCDGAPVEKRRLPLLAAAQLQESRGDYTGPAKFTNGWLAPLLPTIAPATAYDAASLDALERAVALAWEALRGKSPEAAMRAYISAAQEMPSFGAALFETAGLGGAKRTLGVVDDGVVVYFSADDYVFHPYATIEDVEWDDSSISFGIVPPASPQTGGVRRKEYLKLATPQAQTIAELACGYYHLLAGVISVPMTLFKPYDLPPPDAVVARQPRADIVPFSSRLEFFKATLDRLCDEAKVGAPPKAVLAVSTAIDKDTPLSALDMSHSELDEKAIGVISDAFQRTFKMSGQAGVRENLAVESLSLAGNTLGDTPAVGFALKAILSSPMPLHTVNLARTGIGAKCAQQVAEGLRACLQLEDANVSYNAALGNAGVAEIVVATQRVKTMHTLSCASSGLCEKGLQQLLDAVKTHEGLSTLNLSTNKLGEGAGPLLAGLLRSSRNLTELDVSSCELGKSGGKALAEALVENRVLRRLKAGDNKLGDLLVKKVAKAMQTGMLPLQLLDVHLNEVSKDGIKDLFSAAKSDKSCLNTLILSGNTIPDKIGKLLMDAPKITRVTMKACLLTKKAIVGCAELIKSSKTIVRVDIGHNDLTPELLVKLCDAISQASSLEEFSVAQCGLKGLELAPLWAAMKKNRSITRLFIDQTSPLKQGFTQIADILGTNMKLEELSMIEVGSPQEVIDFLAAVPVTTTLKKIDLRHNNLTQGMLAPHFGRLDKVTIVYE